MNPISVVKKVSQVFDVEIDEIKSNARFREIVDARKAIVYILKHHTLLDGNHIARNINKSHCVIIYMYRQAKHLLKYDSGFKYKMNNIKSSLGINIINN